jgi:2-polyprenyl-3-methyl-5-hydroxy-6-metoxy-1,4-benzoquinol methylase
VSTATEAPFDTAKAEAFAFKVIGDVTSTAMGTLSTIGDRLGLFQTLAEGGPATSDEFAARAGIQPRYAREWLSGMACHGYVEYDDATERFSLTPEQAACLVDPDSPLSLSGFFRTQVELWGNVDLLTDAFRHGGGVPQDRFGEEFRCGFERFSRAGFVNHLCAEWIPAMPEVERRLRAGGAAADVGCGNGQALLQLARCYDKARLVGFDLHAPAIESARANAAAAGLADRVRFEVLDAGQGIPGRYDLITCFDVVHDMPRPVEGMRAIRDALTPGGSFFVLEFNFSSDLRGNIDHPFGIGAFGYASSVNYCMTTALAAGGVGTGTCMGERHFREIAAAAGFGEVRRLDFPNNPLNLFFEARA